MNAPAAPDWTAANQRLLAAEFTRLRALLGDGEADEAQARLDDLRAAMDEPATIDSLARLFELSAFERDLLLLAAGVEMDARLAQLCAQASGQPARPWATFGLALAALPAAHWSALAPPEPLRRWRLLELDEHAGLTAGRLRIDERVLHFLGGLNYLDPRLQPLLQAVPGAGLMSHAHAAVVAAAIERLQRSHGRLPPILLHGDDALGQQDVAADIARRLGVTLYQLRAADIPATAHEQAALATLWQREAALLGSALLIVARDDDKPLAPFVARLDGLLLVASRAPCGLDGEAFAVDRPDVPEQRRLWREALGERAAALAPTLDALAGQYRLGARRIAGIAAQLDASDPARLHAACRGDARAMSELAQPIEARAQWHDLVLPEAQLQTLRQIAVHTRHRLTVHHDWGFADGGSRGLGIATLFWGDSGTGKTLAAEVLANALGLALYRIDLSAVVSKYIGETEKNLRRVFDSAEELGAILLFDEADALFGKRSEVKDSHDRYANIEVSYLLQRMEAYRGLAILTTNHKAALDGAFARRLRFVVHFPFPDAAQREALWRGVFPAATPLAALDYAKLARLAVPGGSIRNIALAAAFLAAEAGGAVGMAQLLRAAHLEAAKRDKAISDAETRGWV
ncbi:ATP-binding protein [Pseudomonas citronellolis]|uniref:ATP-binding protein n=1 Tax=Pseudomonas citronellolis TaxID=53408 RepID=UPI002647EDD1|nr:ATP-binding protein [Pseudomonas citronellolis]MDN6873809.1 ATP-binding protein [Pseudomonas citronellolis]